MERFHRCSFYNSKFITGRLHQINLGTMYRDENLQQRERAQMDFNELKRVNGVFFYSNLKNK